ncbi:MAG: alternative ribosome rescue aminoacyl-tRNA hydrolase ArfB, partial [Myxococcota bacterium]
MDDLRITDWLSIPARELSWSAARSSGAGGQNVNKVASKVDLRFDATESEVLSQAVKTRLLEACRNRLDAQGRIQVVSQLTRDQARNLEDARARLADLVRAALYPPRPRRPTRKPRSADRRRLQNKKRNSERKQSDGGFCRDCL